MPTNPTPTRTPVVALDYDLLRRAGEHLGTLAERAREQHDLVTRHSPKLWDRYARLSRLSREVLEVARGQ
jgi:hypothetical protein